MPYATLSLAQSSRTMMQRLIFGEGPALPLWQVLLYDLGLVLIVTTFILVVAMFSIWFERKVAGHIQSRIGPNRVGGFHGWLQSLADGIKLILKEDLIPREADSLLFRLAPYVAFAPVFAAFLALPFAPNWTFEPRLNVGVFFVLAVLSVEVMGVILAGWASNNKWSLYGAMREACQMVSYEIPLGISIIVGVMAAGTLNMVQMSDLQGGGLHTWLIFRNPFAFLSFFVYFIASLAANKRAPFDLPESESELVAGFHTEYSGMRFAFFFFAEYAAMFVVGGIQVSLFLGGWNDPFGLVGYYHHKFVQPDTFWAAGIWLVNAAAAAVFVIKVFVIIFTQMWLRWTLPRPRIDQVLYACVKVLLPAACVLLLGTALWQLFVQEPVGVPWRDYDPLRQYPQGSAVGLVVQLSLAVMGVALVVAITTWVGYAIVTARRVRPRLAEAEPIVIER